MLEHLDREVFKAGEYIFRQADEGDCAFLIESGIVEISNPLTGFKLGLLVEGDLFGEIALIDRHPRTASAMAKVDTVVIRIRRSLVEELLRTTDPVIRHLLQVVLERFRSAVGNPRQAPDGNSDSADELHASVVHDLTLLQDMAYALKDNQFELHYQPIYALADRKLAGYEALIRWRHPTLGMIPPGQFLGLAEKAGHIRDIGLWTLEQACRDWPALRRLTQVESPFICVNVSGKQLDAAGFAEQAVRIQQHMQMPPGELKLELTETTLIENPTLASELLATLLAAGNTLSLDDYGTGYGSLHYLQRYPIKTLKLDITFVREIARSNVSLKLVMSSIHMARALDLNVVAEGVESADVARILEDLGCTYAQGYLYSKPRPLNELCAALAATG